jgi:hypothetical protein
MALISISITLSLQLQIAYMMKYKDSNYINIKKKMNFLEFVIIISVNNKDLSL